MDGAGRLRLLVLGHAADDPADDRDQPDADHAADAVGVRADLYHDPGRAEQQEHDAAVVRLQAGLQSRRLGYGTAIALVLLVIGGVFSLIYLRALASRSRSDEAAVTAQAGTAAPPLTRIRRRGRPRLSGNVGQLVLLVLAAPS